MGKSSKPIYVNGKKVKSLWIPGNSRPYLSRHLIEPARACMGFWRQDNIPLEEKAIMSGLLPGEFIAMNRMLLRSEIGAVEFCRIYGVPPSASVKLKKPLRCNSCRALIISLPCIQCCDGPDDDPHV